jgi:hypothetical protein
MKKNEKKAHITALFGAMINKVPVLIKGDGYTHLIQRIGMDGECDLYNQAYGEVMYHDIKPEDITIKH